MMFLVEIDHPKSGAPLSVDSARAFITGIIHPTLARLEDLIREGRIVAGGPVAGRVALRLIFDTDSLEQLDQLISSIPLWAISDTRVTALITPGDRRAHVDSLLQSLIK